MPFRDRELAQRGRADLLEQELEALRRENDRLRRHRDGVRRHRGATILWVLCAVLATAAVLVGAWVDAWEAEYIAGALGVLRVPLLEHAETMDLRSETIDLELASVATRDGKARVSARALIRLCSQEPRLHNAVERFLGRERAGVMRAARQTIEGAMGRSPRRLRRAGVGPDRVIVTQPAGCVRCGAVETEAPRVCLPSFWLPPSLRLRERFRGRKAGRARRA